MKLPSDAKGGDGERGSESIGIGGRLESEWVADFDRNRRPTCRGIRNQNASSLSR